MIELLKFERDSEEKWTFEHKVRITIGKDLVKKSTEKESETRERISALSFKGNKNQKMKIRIEKKKNAGQYEHSFTDFYFLDCWMIYCVVFYMLFQIVVLVVTVILLVKAT